MQKDRQKVWWREREYLHHWFIMGTYKCIVNLVPSLVKIDEHSVQNQLERVWIYIPIFQSSFERYSYEKLLLGISKKNRYYIQISKTNVCNCWLWSLGNSLIGRPWVSKSWVLQTLLATLLRYLSSSSKNHTRSVSDCPAVG